jgi:hypothetical protein
MFTEDEMKKIEYHACDISSESRYAKNDENLIHMVNEPAMRGYFVKVHQFKDDDIIISVDADEIIYESMYSTILEEVEKHQCVSLCLNQFFYKMNYFWENNVFRAPTAAKYAVYKNKYPAQWRYEGYEFATPVGCHFSWCMTPEEMIYKLNTYSHPKYRFCADLNLLKNSIADKKYPFDPSVDFRIKELDWGDSILPKNLKYIR